MPINDPADQFAVQMNPITNEPDVANKLIDLEVEKDVLTDVEVDALLAKYTPERALLYLYDARERMTKEGQEAWNGDKKLFDIQFNYLTKEIERLEKQVALKLAVKNGKGASACPISVCRVEVI